MKTLSIVGAGLSALSCSYQLIQENANIQIKLFEKSRGIAGRAASRRINGFTFDHGANYMSLDTLNDQQRQNVMNALNNIDQKQERYLINDQIHILNSNDTITYSNRITEKITFPQGINYLGKLLHQYNMNNQKPQQQYELHKQTFISHIEQENDGKWNIFTTDKGQISTSDYVLFTAPAPQVFNIIKNSNFLPEHQIQKEKLLNILIKSQFHQQITIALAFKERIPQDKIQFYALINQDRQNEVAWLSIEDKKPNHVPQDKSMLILQMAPNWSKQNWDQGQEELTKFALNKAVSILGLNKYELEFSNIQKWRYSLPKEQVKQNELEEFAKIGLFFSGDSYCEKGRVGVAFNSGLDTATNILKNSKL